MGGLFYHNYPGGSGLSAGMVFGRLAGASAGQDAMALKLKSLYPSIQHWTRRTIASRAKKRRRWRPSRHGPFSFGGKGL